MEQYNFPNIYGDPTCPDISSLVFHEDKKMIDMEAMTGVTMKEGDGVVLSGPNVRIKSERDDSLITYYTPYHGPYIHRSDLIDRSMYANNLKKYETTNGGIVVVPQFAGYDKIPPKEYNQ